MRSVIAESRSIVVDTLISHQPCVGRFSPPPASLGARRSTQDRRVSVRLLLIRLPDVEKPRQTARTNSEERRSRRAQLKSTETWNDNTSLAPAGYRSAICLLSGKIVMICYFFSGHAVRGDIRYSSCLAGVNRLLPVRSYVVYIQRCAEVSVVVRCGNWVICQKANSWLVDSRTDQLADWKIRGLVRLPTANL